MSRIAVLIAAHNEEASIGETLAAALNQTRPADMVVVMADNCTDRTVEIARQYPGVTVIETQDNDHKKSGALNQAYFAFRREIDFFACLDADTIIPPESLEAWVVQMEAEPRTAGISARFTMQPKEGNTAWQNLLARLQKAEFSRWTDTALNRGGPTTVLAGTACMIRVAALTEVAAERATEGVETGPWSYASDVEDFELTYRVRRLGWNTKVSFTVRAYTDAMVSLRALWAQRMKWQGGTVEDLLRIGVNRLTWRDWMQQVMGMLAAAVRMSWITLIIVFALMGDLHFTYIWVLIPLLFVANDIKHSLRVPHRDHKDILLAATLLPQELFAWMRAGWFIRSWVECLLGLVTHKKKDRWAAQYTAEATAALS